MFHWFSFASTFMDFHVSLCFIDSSDFWWTSLSLLNSTFSWGLGVFASYAVMAFGMWPGASWGKGKSGLRELLANSTYCTSGLFCFKSQKRSKNRRHILCREILKAPSVQTIVCFVKSTGGFSHIRDPNKIQNPSKVMTAEEVVWKSQWRGSLTCAYSTWMSNDTFFNAVFRNELLSLKCGKRIDEGIRYIALRVWILIWKGGGLYT